MSAKTYEFKLPDIGEGVTEGEIVKWLISPGDTVVASVKRTGRVVVVHEAPRSCGLGSEIVALVNEKAFLHLEAPPVRVTGFDTPFPYTLENEYLPLAHRILPAIVETARY